MAGKPGLGGRAHNFKDRTGERHGKLVVLHLDGVEGGKTTCWMCSCDCGNTHRVRSCNLSGGRTLSCGCYRRESPLVGKSQVGKRWAKSTAQSRGLLKIYSDYRGGARARGLAFNLTKSEFTELTRAACHYCGCPPSNKQASIRTFKGIEYPYSITYNGIDRKNNDVGYEPDNCVTCCKACNMAKRDTPYEDFLAWVRRVYAFQQAFPESA